VRQLGLQLRASGAVVFASRWAFFDSHTSKLSQGFANAYLQSVLILQCRDLESVAVITFMYKEE
jgi:hypothetical protein